MVGGWNEAEGGDKWEVCAVAAKMLSATGPKALQKRRFRRIGGKPSKGL
jgi:hypothetical protein